ncbi:MAG: hypothetical protein MJZ98_06705 [Paludibacteraceae bacterium]|nr:hypothetical protein [Paludibacteraceae bacterium]
MKSTKLAVRTNITPAASDIPDTGKRSFHIAITVGGNTQDDGVFIVEVF